MKACGGTNLSASTHCPGDAVYTTLCIVGVVGADGIAPIVVDTVEDDVVVEAVEDVATWTSNVIDVEVDMEVDVEVDEDAGEDVGEDAGLEVVEDVDVEVDVDMDDDAGDAAEVAFASDLQVLLLVLHLHPCSSLQSFMDRLTTHVWPPLPPPPASRLYAKVATPLTVTFTEPLATNAFAVAAKSLLLTTRATTTLPQIA